MFFHQSFFYGLMAVTSCADFISSDVLPGSVYIKINLKMWKFEDLKMQDPLNNPDFFGFYFSIFDFERFDAWFDIG